MISITYHYPDPARIAQTYEYKDAETAAKNLYGPDAEAAAAAIALLPDDAALLRLYQSLGALGQERIQGAARAMIMPSRSLVVWSDKITAPVGDGWKVLLRLEQVNIQMQQQPGPQMPRIQ